jgi:hypothetical protein
MMTTLIHFRIPDKFTYLVEQLDAYVKANDTTRSRFIRDAIADKLAQLTLDRANRRDRLAQK